jgi:hypothetical protein
VGDVVFGEKMLCSPLYSEPISVYLWCGWGKEWKMSRAYTIAVGLCNNSLSYDVAIEKAVSAGELEAASIISGWAEDDRIERINAQSACDATRDE